MFYLKSNFRNKQELVDAVKRGVFVEVDKEYSNGVHNIVQQNSNKSARFIVEAVLRDGEVIDVL